MKSNSHFCIKHIFLAIAAVLPVLGLSSSASASAIISDTFSGSIAPPTPPPNPPKQLASRVPDLANAPGGTYAGMFGFAQWGGSIDGNRGWLGADSGVAINISGTGSYTKPPGFQVSVDLSLNTLTGQSNTFRGFGVGFLNSTSPTTALFYGVIINKNGQVLLVQGIYPARAITSNVGQAQTITNFNVAHTYNLSYVVNTATGGISKVTLTDMNTAVVQYFNFTTTAFTDANTANLCVYADSDIGGTFGYFDNLLLQVPAEAPGTIVQTNETTGGTLTAYIPSSTDLVNAGASTLKRRVDTGYKNYSSASIASINDGLVGTADSATFHGCAYDVDNNWSTTFYLDVSPQTGSPAGYTISEIDSIAAWATLAHQNYTAYYKVVGSNDFVPLGTYSLAYSGTGYRCSRIKLTSSTGVIANGVEAIRFYVNAPATQNVLREFDVFGSPSFTAPAVLQATDLSTSSQTAYPASNTDLINQGQLTLGGQEDSGYTASSGSSTSKLNDGDIGTANAQSTTAYDADGNWTTTYYLNTVSNNAGYAITQIQTLAGWTSPRANQKYEVFYRMVGSTSFVSLGTYSANAGATGATSSRITLNSANGTIVKGVDAIRFVVQAPNFQTGDQTVYREFEVYGYGLPPVLPSLNWQKRSDWINVKTDVTPAAVGDGVADDTAAIQAAINACTVHGTNYPKAVYLPPGTYRITQTLNKQQSQGGLVIGHGRDTRIVWSGTTNGTMYRSDGNARARYVGIIWDGNGVAAVGVEHGVTPPDHFYETRVRHQNEEFINFLTAGIRVGAVTDKATAETLIDHCLFYSCVNGIYIANYNDYNWTIKGCEFQDCNTGAFIDRGNAYVQDCHFERSAATDIYLGSNANSIMRCTSQNPTSFITTGFFTGDQPFFVQDCRVSGWMGEAAIVGMSRGPSTIFDNVFTNALSTNPPIWYDNMSNVIQRSVIANNTHSATATYKAEIPANVTVYTGTTPGALGSSNITAATRFFRQTAHVPTSIIDVTAPPYNVVPYNTGSSSSANDAPAIQTAISAAAAQGNDCMVYFPVGDYRVASQLDMTSGSNYTVGGSGWASRISYQGGTSPYVVHLRDPNNLRIEQLRVESSSGDDKILVLQESTTAVSSMRYDGLFMGIYTGNPIYDPNRKGLQIRDLPSTGTVVIPHMDGDGQFINCSAGTVLINEWLDGVMRFSSSQSTPRTGFLGILTRSGVGNNPFDLVLEGNESLVIGTYYSEQNTHQISLDGSTVAGIAGKVTIHGAKCEVTSNNLVATINKYNGQLSCFNVQYRYQNPSIFETGAADNPIVLLLAGSSFWLGPPSFNNFDAANPYAKKILMENIIFMNDNTPPLPLAIVPNELPTGTDSDLSSALDHFRQLGVKDLQLNYGY